MISLPKQHTINSLLDEYHSKKTTCYLISKQCLKVKSSIVNIKNHLNKIFLVFDSLNRELSSGFCLVDTFPDYFFFHLANQKDVNVKIAH